MKNDPFHSAFENLKKEIDQNKLSTQKSCFTLLKKHLDELENIRKIGRARNIELPASLETTIKTLTRLVQLEKRHSLIGTITEEYASFYVNIREEYRQYSGNIAQLIADQDKIASDQNSLQAKTMYSHISLRINAHDNDSFNQTLINCIKELAQQIYIPMPSVIPQKQVPSHQTPISPQYSHTFTSENAALGGTLALFDKAYRNAQKKGVKSKSKAAPMYDIAITFKDVSKEDQMNQLADLCQTIQDRQIGISTLTIDGVSISFETPSVVSPSQRCIKVINAYITHLQQNSQSQSEKTHWFSWFRSSKTTTPQKQEIDYTDASREIINALDDFAQVKLTTSSTPKRYDDFAQVTLTPSSTPKRYDDFAQVTLTPSSTPKRYKAIENLPSQFQELLSAHTSKMPVGYPRRDLENLINECQENVNKDDNSRTYTLNKDTKESLEALRQKCMIASFAGYQDQDTYNPSSHLNNKLDALIKTIETVLDIDVAPTPQVSTPKTDEISAQDIKKTLADLEKDEQLPSRQRLEELNKLSSQIETRISDVGIIEHKHDIASTTTKRPQDIQKEIQGEIKEINHLLEKIEQAGVPYRTRTLGLKKRIGDRFGVTGYAQPRAGKISSQALCYLKEGSKTCTALDKKQLEGKLNTLQKALEAKPFETQSAQKALHQCRQYRLSKEIIYKIIKKNQRLNFIDPYREAMDYCHSHTDDKAASTKYHQNHLTIFKNLSHIALQIKKAGRDPKTILEDLIKKICRAHKTYRDQLKSAYKNNQEIDKNNLGPIERLANKTTDLAKNINRLLWHDMFDNNMLETYINDDGTDTLNNTLRDKHDKKEDDHLIIFPDGFGGGFFINPEIKNSQQLQDKILDALSYIDKEKSSAHNQLIGESKHSGNQQFIKDNGLYQYYKNEESRQPQKAHQISLPSKRHDLVSDLKGDKTLEAILGLIVCTINNHSDEKLDQNLQDPTQKILENLFANLYDKTPNITQVLQDALSDITSLWVITALNKKEKEQYVQSPKSPPQESDPTATDGNLTQTIIQYHQCIHQYKRRDVEIDRAINKFCQMVQTDEDNLVDNLIDQAISIQEKVQTFKADCNETLHHMKALRAEVNKIKQKIESAEIKKIQEKMIEHLPFLEKHDPSTITEKLAGINDVSVLMAITDNIGLDNDMLFTDINELLQKNSETNKAWHEKALSLIEKSAWERNLTKIQKKLAYHAEKTTWFSRRKFGLLPGLHHTFLNTLQKLAQEIRAGHDKFSVNDHRLLIHKKGLMERITAFKKNGSHKILEDLKTRCNHANNTMALTKIYYEFELFELNHHVDNLLSKTLGKTGDPRTVNTINAIFDTAEEMIKEGKSIPLDSDDFYDQPISELLQRYENQPNPSPTSPTRSPLDSQSPSIHSSHSSSDSEVTPSASELKTLQAMYDSAKSQRASGLPKHQHSPRKRSELKSNDLKQGATLSQTDDKTPSAQALLKEIEQCLIDCGKFQKESIVGLDQKEIDALAKYQKQAHLYPEDEKGLKEFAKEVRSKKNQLERICDMVNHALTAKTEKSLKSILTFMESKNIKQDIKPPTWLEIVPQKWQYQLNKSVIDDNVDTSEVASVYKTIIAFRLLQESTKPTQKQANALKMKTLSAKIDAKLKQLAQSPRRNASGASSSADGPSTDGPRASHQPHSLK